MKITPLILGHGRAGEAIAKSLLCLKVTDPDLKLSDPVFLARDASLETEARRHENPLLCLAQPHGLHADGILRAAAAGFRAIACEKPACVNLEQLARLKGVSTPTAIFHVYRQMWGPQTLKELLASGELGELITLEGRYWQASTAERALKPAGVTSWKNSVQLAGAYDTFIDVGTHWVDAASFLFSEAPAKIEGWRSFANAEAPHRDSHVQLNLSYSGARRVFSSISKTVHGAQNHFELNVIGTKKSATWEFQKPDEIRLGEGRDLHLVTRKDSREGSRQPPHHGLGWLEGYVEILRRLIGAAFHGASDPYPNLGFNLEVLEAMLKTQWNK